MCMQVYEEAASLPEYRKWDTNVLQKGNLMVSYNSHTKCCGLVKWPTEHSAGQKVRLKGCFIKDLSRAVRRSFMGWRVSASKRMASLLSSTPPPPPVVEVDSRGHRWPFSSAYSVGAIL